MFNFKSLLPIALLTVSGVASMNVSANETALDAQQVAQLIEKADSYRLQDDSSKVVSLVRLYQDQELDKTRLYHVYTRPNRESLVVFKSAVEAGQKDADDGRQLLAANAKEPPSDSHYANAKAAW